MTSNGELLDRYIRHQTYLIRYAGGLRNKAGAPLVKTEKELYDAIIKWVSKSPTRTLTGNAGRKWQADFAKQLGDIRYPVWKNMGVFLQDEFHALAVSESNIAAYMIETSFPTNIVMARPAISQLEGIVNSQPFEGRTLKGWLKRTAEADVQRMLAATKIGIVQGRTPHQVATSILGTRAMQYRDGVSRKAFRDMESVLLTLTNGVQNEAKQALYGENSDIIKQEQFVATLDARTTLECASYDGQLFKQGVGPIPPLHFRCRSMRVPYIDYGDIGARGFDSRTEKELLKEYTEQSGVPLAKTRGELPRGHKTKYDAYSRKRGEELVGQVPSKLTYNDWLKGQTKEFQNKVLGPTRATLFRKGDLHLSKFVARDGDVLTLQQLKNKGLSLP